MYASHGLLFYRSPVLYPQILPLTAAQDKIIVDTMLCPW